VKKIVDIAQIEAREKELVEELAQLRSFKKYASKFGSDYGQAPVANGTGQAPADSSADAEKVLRDIIAMFNKAEFNYQSLERVLVESGKSLSRSSVFDVLAKFKEAGEIQVVRPGAGRRPAEYKVTDKFCPF
jgi:hypothetical protein